VERDHLDGGRGGPAGFHRGALRAMPLLMLLPSSRVLLLLLLLLRLLLASASAATGLSRRLLTMLCVFFGFSSGKFFTRRRI
jgi:hypothetical protein